MGLISQLLRGIRSRISSVFDSIGKRLGRKRKFHDSVPRSWRRKERSSPDEEAPAVIKHRIRVPGLLFFKRLLAGFLLLVNFVFSQFLLGSVGEGAQPMFLIFLLNAFILADYLWKTRRANK